jgi:steroid delta-isomerase-like uncharacterized protein
MASDEHSSFIGRHAAAWNRHDVAGLCANHADDGVIISPMFSRVEGRSQILSSYTSLFTIFPDWELGYHDAVCEGRRISISFRVRATHRGEFMGLAGTGRGFEVEGVSLFTLDDDLRIREERRVYDFTGLLTQLGILRIRPAR